MTPFARASGFVVLVHDEIDRYQKVHVVRTVADVG